MTTEDLVPTDAKATPLVKPGGDLQMKRTTRADGAPVNRIVCNKADLPLAQAFAAAFDGGDDAPFRGLLA